MLTLLTVVSTWVRARRGDDDRGAAMVEYALLVAFVAVLCIGTIAVLGIHIMNKLSETGGYLSP